MSDSREMRELDAKVAVRVFGYEIRPILLGHDIGLVAPDGRAAGVVPRYSTDIGAAWKIVENVYAARAYFSLELTADSTWVAQIGAYPPVEAATAPLAICRAALSSPDALVPL